MTWSTLIAGTDRDVVFDLVRAAAWADGRLNADELAAVHGTAIALDVLARPGVPGSLSRRRNEPGPDLSGLGVIGRHVAFAAAAWIAWIDGPPTPGEADLLARLAARLGLRDGDVNTIVREVARSSDEIKRSDAAAMNAQDWAVEIDGLLSWATMFAREVATDERCTASSVRGTSAAPAPEVER